MKRAVDRSVRVLILLVLGYAMFLHFTSPEFWDTSYKDYCYWDGMYVVCE